MVKALGAECLGSSLGPVSARPPGFGHAVLCSVRSFEMSSCFTLAEVTWLPAASALAVSTQKVWSLPAAFC